jgi:hypothetical protein
VFISGSAVREDANKIFKEIREHVSAINLKWEGICANTEPGE